MNYRLQSKEHLKRAREELGKNLDQHIKYAALELRMAIEAITYDRAQAYKDEFPPSEYETWQPRKVMSALLDIDPMADQDCSLAVGVEEVYGAPARKMHSLGSEKVLNMKVLKTHYDALGSYLHVSTLKQARSLSTPDFVKFRNRCEAISEFLKQALSSPVFNITMGSFSTISCFECKNPIRKRVPKSVSDLRATCYQCNATYTLSEGGDGKVEWMPHQQEVECANSRCDTKIVVWEHEMEVGRFWECQSCNGRNSFAIGLVHQKSAER